MKNLLIQNGNVINEPVQPTSRKECKIKERMAYKKDLRSQAAR